MLYDPVLWSRLGGCYYKWRWMVLRRLKVAKGASFFTEVSDMDDHEGSRMADYSNQSTPIFATHGRDGDREQTEVRTRVHAVLVILYNSYIPSVSFTEYTDARVRRVKVLYSHSAFSYSSK